jgi:NAD+ kinase
MRVWTETLLNKNPIKRMLKNRGIRHSRIRPSLVITFGGDGSILAAERKFPGVPKIPVRESPPHGNCVTYKLSALPGVLDKVLSGEYRLEERQKVEARLGGKLLTGLNEIQLRNIVPYRSLRFSVMLGGRTLSGLAGDGLLVSTPFGSTAYYASMGHSPFRSGLMLAFNNVPAMRKPIPVREPLSVRILRERALLVADNNPSMLRTGPRDTVLIEESGQKARFVVV